MPLAKEKALAQVRQAATAEVVAFNKISNPTSPITTGLLAEVNAARESVRVSEVAYNAGVSGADVLKAGNDGLERGHKLLRINKRLRGR